MGKRESVITEKQKKILEFIESYSKKHDASPTLTEIQKNFGFSAIGTVQYYIQELVQKGYIARAHGKWASIEVVREKNSIPLLGKVAAGTPIQYLSHNEKIEVPPQMVKSQGGYFALQVKGDSMIDEGIWDGDYVIIKKQDSAENKQIVVAQINNEATIKRFFKKKNQIELHSANEKYAPIIVKDNQTFQIEGVYCGLLRYP